MNHKSVVFEYNCMCWYGNSYNIKLFADGALVKLYYGYPKLGPEHRMEDDQELTTVISPEMVNRIKTIIQDNKETLNNLPRELSNPHILDGAEETLKLGRMKFTGCNMFTTDIENFLDYYKTLPLQEQEAIFIPLSKLQKIFNEIKKVLGDYWDEDMDE